MYASSREGESHATFNFLLTKNPDFSDATISFP